MSEQVGQNGASKSLAVAGTTTLATTEGDDFFKKRALARVQAKVGGILIPEEDFLKQFIGKSEAVEAVGDAYYALRTKMEKPTDDGAEWRPVRVAIASKKSDKHEAAYKAAGAGGLYEASTDRAIPKATKWFPLFAPTQENNLFKDRAVVACSSLDGETGRQVVDFAGNAKGTTHLCGGPSCPNQGYTNRTGEFTKKPALYQSIPQDCCQPDKVVYMVDEKFTNIYKVALRHFSIKPTYGVMSAAQKNEELGLQFDPTIPGTTWWNLGTVEQTIDTKQGPSKAHYYKAEKSDAPIDEWQAKALQRLSLFLGHQWFPKQVGPRSTNAGRAQTPEEAISVLEASTTVDADGEAFTEV